jgi:hypothetical protein
MTYQPPTRVATVDIPWLALVNDVDPDWAALKHREAEYIFTRKVFYADPYVRGAYNVNSNIYPVGQPFGGPDPVIVANKPLYSGIPTGGWA